MLDLPLEIRLALLFVLGVLVGRQLNRGIYSPGLVSPRSGTVVAAARGCAASPCRWTACRWWAGGVCAASRAWHGTGYWIRPLLIELATGVGFAVLYWGEVDQRVALARSAGCGTALLDHAPRPMPEPPDSRVADDRGDVH